MLRMLLARWQQGYRTAPYPQSEPVLPDRFRGLPVLDASRCPDGCRQCAEACPTEAITAPEGRLELDLGRCLFCTDCTQACPEGAIQYTPEYRLAVRSRSDLVLRGQALARAQALDEKMRRLFGRSLKLRQGSAGGWNGWGV